uniref:PKD domain-containing protein n=1 Tax=Microbispora sp. H10836 TaxID=2729106 RepID=UPI0014743C0F
PIPLKAIAVSGPFAQTNACPVELAVGHSCVVEVRFAPAQEGPASGALTFTTADGAEPAYTLPLTGTGAAVNAVPVIKPPATPLRGVVGKPLTLTVEFTDPDTGDNHTAMVSWGAGQAPVPVTVTSRPGGGTVTATTTFTSATSGRALVLVYDGVNGPAGLEVPYVIEEAGANTAPVVSPGPDAEVSTGEALQRTVTFTDPDSTSWTATVDYGDGSGPQPVTPTAAKQIALEHQWATAGTYPVTVKVTDDGGLEATATFTVTVTAGQTPNQAPEVTVRTSMDTVEAGSTWIGLGSFTDPDSGDWSYTVDYGDGSGPQPLTPTAGQLKLEHVFASAGDYTVVLTVTDDKGGAGSAQVVVHVTNAAPQVALKAPPETVAVGEPVTFSGSFTDAGVGDSHTATWTVGGRQVAGAVAERHAKPKAHSTAKTTAEGKSGPKSGVEGTVDLPYVFTEPGVYEVAVTVADDHGGRTTADTVEGAKVRVLVYDRTASVVGAGTVATPAGACTVTTECAKEEGKASFTLTAHYPYDNKKKNKGKGDTPTGELTYTAPGFTLGGASYRVLSATGGTATLRGTGTVKGAGKVVFEITATDPGAGKPDQLHLVVWNSKGERIYDNQPTGSPSPVNGVLRVSG